MRYKVIIIISFCFILENSYSQAMLDMRCVFYPQYILDITYKKADEWRYLPIEKDSLFLFEEIIISKWEDLYSYKEYEKIMKKTFNQLTNSSFFYVEMLSQGVSNFNHFQDFIFYDSNPINVSLNYQRVLYSQKLTTKNSIYTINFKVVIPRVWEPNEKWNLSIQHFSERKEFVKLIYNSCRN